MSAASQDSERAAAIGNTEALKQVLMRSVSDVARERVNGAPDSILGRDEQTYTVVLGKLIMKLIENERENATQRGFAIRDENATALTNAVQQIRNAE